MIAVPSATPVTSAVVPTVATAGALDVHVTPRPVSTLPRASVRVATSWTVAPMSTHGRGAQPPTDAPGAVEAAVATVAVFDSSPNTASWLRRPRNATSWNE